MNTNPSQNANGSRLPPGSGFGYPIRPVWIHDILNLWQRNRLITALREQAMERTAQEVGSPVARCKSIDIIIRHFVPIKGNGRTQSALSPNVWSAYSQLYPTFTLTPAYLFHLSGVNDLARVATNFIQTRYTLGDQVKLPDIRRHLIARFGDHRTVYDGASAFLRTLEYFGVFAGEGRLGNYRYATNLTVERTVFSPTGLELVAATSTA